MRVGLFGGTFNPPHLGHRVIAEQAVEALDLDRLIWMPALRSPLKDVDGDVAFHHRLAMTSLAASNHAGFVVSDLESKREPPSYTVDTLRDLKEVHPEWDLHLLVGADTWNSFARWKSPEEIRRLAGVVVYPRADGGGDTGFAQSHPGSAETDVTCLDSPRIQISSTIIRRRLKEGSALSGLVDGKVLAYIQHHNLYRGLNAEET